MSTVVSSVKDAVAARPIVDWPLPIVTLILWLQFGSPLIPELASARSGIYGATSALAGFVLAAATFACTMTYHGNASLLLDLRKRFQVELRRNWIAILWSTALCALLPIIGIYLDPQYPLQASGIVVFVAAMLCLRFARSLWWLKVTLFVTQLSPEESEAETPKLTL